MPFTARKFMNVGAIYSEMSLGQLHAETGENEIGLVLSVHMTCQVFSPRLGISYPDFLFLARCCRVDAGRMEKMQHVAARVRIFSRPSVCEAQKAEEPLALVCSRDIIWRCTYVMQTRRSGRL